MSVSATRRVSSSTQVHRKLDGTASGGNAFVEAIDSSRAVRVKDELDEEKKKKRQEQQFELEKKQNKISADAAYVNSAITALEASGVYEEIGEATKSTINKVNVYNNNQTIANDEDIQKRHDEYIKQFFDGHELVDEVDEFI